MKKRWVLLLAVILGIVFLWTQVLSPVKASVGKVECISWDATYDTIENEAKLYHNGSLPKETIAYGFTGELPSKNPKDYMTIYCNFETQNTSILERYTVNAVLKDAEKYRERILFVSDANATVIPIADRMDKVVGNIILHVYIKDMSEAEIEELVRGLELTVKAYGKHFGTEEKTLSYKNCEDITIEFAENEGSV